MLPKILHILFPSFLSLMLTECISMFFYVCTCVSIPKHSAYNVAYDMFAFDSDSAIIHTMKHKLCNSFI